MSWFSWVFKRRLALILLGILGFGALAWVLIRGDASSRLAAPAFVLQDAQGSAWSLKDAGDQPVMLHFWAAWCAPCIEELPAFIRFAEKMGSEKVQFVAVSLDKTWEAARKVIPAQVPQGFVVLLDPDLKVANQYGSYQFPETYLINDKREIVMKWVGQQKWESPQMAAFISRFLQDNQTPAPQ